jgi:hypothetical protein
VKTEYNADCENNMTATVTQECPTSEMDDDVRRALATKNCVTCKCVKSISDFYFNRKKDSYFSECKQCNKKRASNWNKENFAQYKKNCKRHKELNPGLYLEYKRKEYSKNKERYTEYQKKYRASAEGKGIRQALERDRGLRKEKACPSWLSKEHRKQMQEFYISRPKNYHVDHIVPLKGKNVSGLHVPWNLQYLPASDNLKKRNKF